MSGNRRTRWNDSNDGWDSRSNSRSDYKKKSGCKIGVSKNGRQYITGWNVSKERGYITFIANRANDIEYSSRGGKIWHRYVVNISIKRTMEKRVVSGLFDIDSKKLIIKELGMVANPKGGRGGYFGTFNK